MEHHVVHIVQNQTRAGIKNNVSIPKKSLGQHWLTSRVALEAMCSESALSEEDIVLEIGPGQGVLTELLVQTAKQVYAVELDQDLLKELPARVPASNLELIEADILQFDLRTIPQNYKVVANIPYYITNKLIRLLLEAHNAPIRSTLLIQKEVAERIAAKPGNMSILAVSVQFYSEVVLGPVVPAKDFHPAPEVDSQIITLIRREKPLFDVDARMFFRIVKAGFSEKRKKLGNALSGGLHISKEQAREYIERAGLGVDVRAQELSLDNWYALYRIMQ